MTESLELLGSLRATCSLVGKFADVNAPSRDACFGGCFECDREQWDDGKKAGSAGVGQLVCQFVGRVGSVRGRRNAVESVNCTVQRHDVNLEFLSVRLTLQSHALGMDCIPC